MAFDKKNLDDYNDVASRMAEFFTKYPEGSFQSGFHFQEIGGRDVVIVQASAYRTPDDQRPGVGLAYEFIPVPPLTPRTPSYRTPRPQRGDVPLLPWVRPTPRRALPPARRYAIASL